MTALSTTSSSWPSFESGRAGRSRSGRRRRWPSWSVRPRLCDRADRADVKLEVTGDRDAELPLRPRMLAVVVENLIQNTLRYAGPGTTLRSPSTSAPQETTLRRRRRRCRARRERSPSSLRALLPQRPCARLAGHRPRPRDREARRHLRRRLGRGLRRARARARDSLPLPCGLTPVLHQRVTTFSPWVVPRDEHFGPTTESDRED